MDFDAIVIGAGIGGLASAAILAANKKNVLVLEATDRAGGYQRRFESGGFAFEPHFHFLQDAGPNRPVRQLLESIGVDQVFEKLEPVASISFPDQVIDIPNCREDFICNLKELFPSEAKGIDTLFETMYEIYHAITQQQPSELLMLYGGDTLEQFLARFVNNSRLKAIAGAWAAYFGYGSAHISALAIISFTESCWDGGIYHPQGGIKSLTDKLLNVIAQHGGQVRFNVAVDTITTEDGAVSGIKLDDGSSYLTPVVISSIDTTTTMCDLLDDPSLTQPLVNAIKQLPRFRSPFCVFLGVKSEGLDLQSRAAVCVDFVSDDIEAQDKAQLEGDMQQAPISLGIPTHFNDELALPEHDIVIIYTFVANEDIDVLLHNKAKSEAFAEQLIARAESNIPNLSEHIVTMETSATATAMLYNDNTKGGLGWSPTPETLPQMPGHSCAVDGLYLAGQWTRTGGGMNNVFSSAQIASSLALSEKLS